MGNGLRNSNLAVILQAICQADSLPCSPNPNALSFFSRPEETQQRQKEAVDSRTGDLKLPEMCVFSNSPSRKPAVHCL